MIRIALPVVVVVALVAGSVRAAQPYESVVNTPHNFFARSEFPIGSRVCYGCHAEGPGRAGLVPAEGAVQAPEPVGDGATRPPLWQRDASAYTVSSVTDGGSSACLGCHDGVLGQEVHRLGTPDARAFDHPYDVVYPRRANGQFVPERPMVNQYRYWSIPDLRQDDLILPTGPTSSLLALPTAAGRDAASDYGLVRTLQGKVQCDSCHDPHDNGSAPFLRAPARDLCLICHDR